MANCSEGCGPLSGRSLLAKLCRISAIEPGGFDWLRLQSASASDAQRPPNAYCVNGGRYAECHPRSTIKPSWSWTLDQMPMPRRSATRINLEESCCFRTLLSWLHIVSYARSQANSSKSYALATCRDQQLHAIAASDTPASTERRHPMVRVQAENSRREPELVSGRGSPTSARC